MQECIVSNIDMILDGYSTRRNIQKVEVSHDLSAANHIENEIISLAINNVDNTNTSSTISLGATTCFLHIQCDGPLSASFTKGEVTIVDVINKITIRDGNYDNVTLTNLSTTVAVDAKVIYA